ncbi:MAG: S-methyl-5'-thioinosine phosphorylase [Gammaproteobacteria bacterium]|nr:S-methyl-5'-thioinosine phosphorylase [Gammaproteobacteria bacterium]
MTTLAIIGGTGLTTLDGLTISEHKYVETPFGEPSSPLLIGKYEDKDVIFLPRHGQAHTIAPHRVNYRANIWALYALGVENIIAIAAVGAIESNLEPGTLAVPDQLIDYTYGREQSFYSDDFTADRHLDFTQPYNQVLRKEILASAVRQQITITDGGTYGATQGPRLETAAEIRRLAQDGCSMVGMTGMPEAYLARELDMAYACCAVMANWAAGITDNEIEMAEIEQVLNKGMKQVKQVLADIIRLH